jgi:hypothetical protein
MLVNPIKLLKSLNLLRMRIETSADPRHPCIGNSLLSQLARQRAVSERKLVWSYLAVATGHSTLASTTDTFVLRLAECRHVDKPVFSKVHKEPVIHRWILPYLT